MATVPRSDCSSCRSRGVAGLRQPGVERGVDRGVDAADEEARHAGDARGIAAARDERFETIDVRLGGPLVGVLREQQRDVDVDALRDQLAHRGDALRRARHLDHQVGAPDGGPQAPRVRKRALRVGCKQRRHLQAHVPVAPRRPVVHRAEHIGGLLDVAYGKRLVEHGGVDGRGARRLEDVGVVGAAGHGLLEDRGIRGDAAHAVLVHQALQFAAREQAAPDGVEPDGLSEQLQRTERILERGHLRQPPQVAALAGEPGVQERVHQLARQLAADHAAAEHEHVHVVVLDALVGGVGVVAQAGAYAGDAVGRHRGADAAAAQDDPAIGAMLAQRGAHRRGVIRVIDALAAVGADVQHLAVLARDERLDGFLQREAGVIRSDCYPHVQLSRPISRLAFATTFSGVNPNFFCSSPSGADAPNVSIPIATPASPTYRAHPSVDPCSTDTRAATDEGSTCSRYSGCSRQYRSNSSQEGMLTTRVRMPSASSR